MVDVVCVDSRLSAWEKKSKSGYRTLRRACLSLSVFIWAMRNRENMKSSTFFFFLVFRVRFFLFCLRERRVLVTDIIIFLILISYRFFFWIVFPVFVSSYFFSCARFRSLATVVGRNTHFNAENEETKKQKKTFNL
jgi:hypothetical protein